MSSQVVWNGTTRSIPAAGELNWSALSNFLVDLGTNAQTTNFQKIGMRVATTSPVTVSATSDCVVVCKLSVAGAVAVNLPAGSTKQLFCIVDGTGDAATNNITITPNGAETINGAATYVIDGNRNGIIIAFTGTEWVILAEFLASSSGDIPRAQIAAGTASYVLINDGSGNMSEEAQLAASRGGLGTNASAFTGVVKAAAGSFSAATVVNADVSASAAIDHSKLANITAGQVLIGNGSNVPTATALSGDVTVNSSGVTAIGSGVIVNDDINASAAIVDTKLATISTAGKVSNSATTATSSNTASAIVARDGSGNFTAGTITATLSGTATNVSGTVAIANGGTGQTTANAALNAILPSQTSNSGKALTTNGTDTQWTAVATDPTTTRGDLLRRGAAALERFAAVTDNRVVRGDGTDVISGQIDDPGFFTTGAAAGASSIGIVTTSAQTFAGVKTFNDGIVLDDAAGQDTLNFYQSESVGASISVTGGCGTGATANIWATRVGDLVTLRITVTTGTGPSTSNGAIAASTIPSWARPGSNFYSAPMVYSWSDGYYTTLRVNTDGSIDLYFKDVDTGASATWPTSASLGAIQLAFTIN